MRERIRDDRISRPLLTAAAAGHIIMHNHILNAGLVAGVERNIAKRAEQEQ